MSSVLSLRRTPRGTLRASGVSASLFLSALLALSCRDLGSGPPAGATTPVVKLAAGDTLRFDSYSVDAYGYTIPQSHREVTWAVVSTGGSFMGKTGVTTVEQGPPAEPLSTAPDTLRFRFLENGDIEQFGYLAEAARRRDSVVLVPQWDRIAAFSLGTGGGWEVGTIDEDSIDLVRGTVTDYEDYVTLRFNGVSLIVRAYTVSLSASTFYAEVSVAESPGIPVRLAANAVPGGPPGTIMEVTEVKTSAP
jgi:hypothetical protein